MGLCGGDAAFTDPAARARSEQIDRDLKQEKRAFQNEQKLLLLGTTLVFFFFFFAALSHLWPFARPSTLHRGSVLFKLAR